MRINDDLSRLMRRCVAATLHRNYIDGVAGEVFGAEKKRTGLRLYTHRDDRIMLTEDKVLSTAATQQLCITHIAPVTHGFFQIQNRNRLPVHNHSKEMCGFFQNFNRAACSGVLLYYLY